MGEQTFTTEGHEGTFYLDCGGVYMTVHICQNSENYTSKEGESYTVYFTKLDLKTVAFYVILGDTIVNNASDTNEPEQIIFKQLVSNPTVAAP